MRTTVALFVLCACLRGVAVQPAALSDDEAIYAVVAREMLAGRVLYRDIIDHKPPLIYATYAATQAVGGPQGGMVLVHLLTLLVVFATGLALRRLVRRHADVDDDTATMAAVLWLVFTTTMIDFDSLAANCELFMVLPLVVSVDRYLSGQRLLAGILVGVATLYKYQAAIHLPLYALHLAWTQRAAWRVVLSGWIAIAIGFAGVLALAVLALWAGGALPAALFWFKFNFAYIQSGMAPLEVLSRAIVRISIVVGGAALLYALGVAGAVRALLPARVASTAGTAARAFQRFACAWLVASALAVCVGGRFYGHYFHQVTPVLALLAAPGALALYRRHRAVATTALAVPAVAFVLVAALHTRVMAMIGQPDLDYGRMAAAIRATSAPGDGLCIWGNLPVLYFVAERPLGCRFAFANYLTGMSPATNTQYDPTVDASMNIVPEAWTMLEEDFATRKPRVVVDSSYSDVGNYGKFPVAKFPRLDVILRRDYHEVAVVEGVRLLVRNASSAGANRSAADRQVASPRIEAPPNDRMP